MCNSCWFFNFIFLKFRYNLFHVLVDSVCSAWSLRNFSTIFLTYLSCRESGLPITSSALYGGFIVTSLNTTMFDPFHITYKNLCGFFLQTNPFNSPTDSHIGSALTWSMVFEIAIYSFWPSGLTPAETAENHRFFCSQLFRTRVLNWFQFRIKFSVQFSHKSNLLTYSLQIQWLRWIRYFFHFLLHLNVAAQGQVDYNNIV